MTEHLVTHSKARSAFRQYLDTVRKELKQEPTLADIDHSALLGRLLRGHPVLPKPPPRSFSYPNYSLGEGKPTLIAEMRHYDRDGRPNMLIIDQCDDWDIVNDLEIRHLPTGEIYRLNRPVPNWHVDIGDADRPTLQGEVPREICWACDDQGKELTHVYHGTDDKGNYLHGIAGQVCRKCNGTRKLDPIPLLDEKQ